MKSAILVVFVAFLILSAVRSPILAETQTLDFQEGDGGPYSTTQATYIGWIGSGNYGSSTALYVSVDVVVLDFTPGARTLIRFPDIIGNNGGQIPPGATIESAFLQLTRMNSSTHGAVMHLIAGAWDENTVSGDNAPGYTSPSAGSFPAGDAGPAKVNITSVVQAWASGTPNWGLELLAGYATAEFSEDFYSDDVAGVERHPLLVVTFTPPPLSPVEASTWGKVKALYR
jgi:hypothetical protein